MTDSSETFLKRIVSLLLSVAIISWLVYAVYGVSKQYSYWFDELFSIVASSLPFSQQLDICLNDVHPPLYEILLSVWIQIFGNSEAATRSLSVFFVAASFPAIYHVRKGLNTNLAILFAVIFFSNWLVYFYAQEARPYGLLLMLSTWSFALFLRNEKIYIFPRLVLLGLTHFFGTLQALLYTIWLIIEDRKQKALFTRAAATALLVTVWPITYLLSGNGAELVGGNFWIKSTPVDAINQAIQVGFPALHFLIGRISPFFGPGAFKILLLVAAPIFLLLFWRGFRSIDRHSQIVALKALYLASATAISVAIINMHTPISTNRNFIVMVPATSLLITIAAWGLLKIRELKIAVLPVFVTVFAISQYQIFNTMNGKFTPHQDWKGASRLAEDVAAERKLKIFVYSGLVDNIPEFQIAREAYYFSDRARIGLITTLDVANLHSGSIIVFGHIINTAEAEGKCYNEFLQDLDNANVKYDVKFAEQAWKCQNGYVVIE